MAVRTVALPELFSGEGKTHWDDWIDHFERIADVNEWDNAKKLKWLPARLTGRAATAYRRLPEATRADLKKTKEALEERFEPASRKELYRAELGSRRKQKSEDWATYGEELNRIAEKAYPKFEVDAQQRLALNQFLTQLDNPQIAFGVRQKGPKTVDEAVQITLELESYLPPKGVRIAQVNAEGPSDTEVEAAISGPTRRQDPLDQIIRRLDQIETDLRAVKDTTRKEKAANQPRRNGPQRTNREDPIICHRCKQPGHIARGCRAPRRDDSNNQGNEKPSAR